jgi:hypothetical protein
MTDTAHIVVTLTVFATMFAPVVVRPHRWNKAWWTMLGSPVAALRTCKTSIAIDQLPGDQPLPSFSASCWVSGGMNAANWCGTRPSTNDASSGSSPNGHCGFSIFLPISRQGLFTNCWRQQPLPLAISHAVPKRRSGPLKVTSRKSGVALLRVGRPSGIPKQSRSRRKRHRILDMRPIYAPCRAEIFVNRTGDRWRPRDAAGPRDSSGLLA